MNTLAEFKDSARAVDPFHVNRTVDACNWISGDGKPLFHERTTHPWSPFKQMSSQYWTEAVYSDRALCEREAKQFGGEVVECFYCDPESPLWFVAFDDLDKALEFSFYKLSDPGPSQPERLSGTERNLP